VNYAQAEDFTTPRVCLPTSVEAAVRGKFGSSEPRYFGQREMYVYAARSLVRPLIPRSGEDLSTPENPWGPDWSYSAYARANGLDPGSEVERAEVVRGRVSDDPKDSKVVWSLAPVRMGAGGPAVAQRFQSTNENPPETDAATGTVGR